MKYYLSVPCVGCPWVFKDLKGQACLAAHCFSASLCQQPHHVQLSKHFPFIDHGRQRRTNTWSLKQRVHSVRQKWGISCFTIFGKDASG